MKKVSITVQYDEEKLSTIKICMEKKGLNINDEIIKFIDSQYTKQVPAQVRDFFDMKAELEKKALSKPNVQPKSKEDKK